MFHHVRIDAQDRWVDLGTDGLHRLKLPRAELIDSLARGPSRGLREHPNWRASLLQHSAVVTDGGDTEQGMQSGAMPRLPALQDDT